MNSRGRARWTKGSWVALAYALFIFVTNAAVSVYSFNLPSDGWSVSQSLTSNPPSIVFEQPILDTPAQIQPGDQLLAVNGKPLEEILDEQYAFYDMQPPVWPNGTVLRYDVLQGW
jgi:hypothetical protein